MSIFLDSIVKQYNDNDYTQQQMVNINYNSYQITNSEILDGYLHSLYINLDDCTYNSIYKQYFEPYDNRLSVLVSDTNEVRFILLNPNKTLNEAYITYDIYTIQNTTLKTLNFENLIYSTDQINRRIESVILQYEQSYTMQNIAYGKWIFLNSGYLMLGYRQIPCDFKEPVCLNIRRNYNLGNTIQPSTRVYPATIDEISTKYKIEKFIFYMTPTKCLYKWNTQSMINFMQQFNIPMNNCESTFIKTRTNNVV